MSSALLFFSRHHCNCNRDLHNCERLFASVSPRHVHARVPSSSDPDSYANGGRARISSPGAELRTDAYATILSPLPPFSPSNGISLSFCPFFATSFSHLLSMALVMLVNIFSFIQIKFCILLFSIWNTRILFFKSIAVTPLLYWRLSNIPLCRFF